MLLDGTDNNLWNILGMLCVLGKTKDSKSLGFLSAPCYKFLALIVLTGGFSCIYPKALVNDLPGISQATRGS